LNTYYVRKTGDDSRSHIEAHNIIGKTSYADSDPGHDSEGPNSTIGIDPQLSSPDKNIDTEYVIRGRCLQIDIPEKWKHIANQVYRNFRTSTSSPCRNAGVIIRGITNGHSGAAPDIGAIEESELTVSGQTLLITPGESITIGQIVLRTSV
jgi:hypothetical protein